jgi:hypothetical protein
LTIFEGLAILFFLRWVGRGVPILPSLGFAIFAVIVAKTLFAVFAELLSIITGREWMNSVFFWGTNIRWPAKLLSFSVSVLCTLFVFWGYQPLRNTLGLFPALLSLAVVLAAWGTLTWYIFISRARCHSKD